MIVRLIIFGILIFLLIRIIRALFFSPKLPHSQIFPGGGESIVNDMVQDPHCGIYVDTTKAFSTRVGNKVLYFCGEECCKEYLKNQEKYFEE